MEQGVGLNDIDDRYQGPSFDAIYRNQMGWVRALVLARVRCQADADEITQEVFVRAYHALPRFRGDDVRPWLCRIAQNACTDHHRRSSRVQLQPIPENYEVVAQAETELSYELEAALRCLPPRQALALYLRSEGWSNDDLAASMGTTSARIKALLYRARCTFRRQWSASV